MGRHEQREQVFMLLFRVEFHTPEEMPRQERLFFEDNETVTREKDAAYIEAKEKAVREKISEIDQIIDKNTEGWDTTRMGKSLPFSGWPFMKCCLMKTFQRE